MVGAQSHTQSKKTSSEIKTMRTMIAIYCNGVHKNKEISDDTLHKDYASKKTLCPECEALFAYAFARIEACPFMETKTFCSSCQVHCYSPDRREDIRRVMRYSGPRMLFHNPIMAIRHVISSRKAGTT